MTLLRRDLLKAAGPALLALGPDAWAVTGDGSPKCLVVVLLRGAVDGLNVVVPYAEERYYSERQSIAIAPPDKPNGGLALDAHFALHPALAAVMPLWAERSLAFVHAAGSPDPTRSHFDAQLYLETGSTGASVIRDGWMNRLLLALPGPRGAIDAVAIGPTVPQIFAGKAPVATLPLGPKGVSQLPIDKPETGAVFDHLYSGNDELGRSYREGRAARAELIDALMKERRSADNGAPPPTGFPGQATRLAALMRSRSGIRLAAIGLGGWDTHVNQGNYAGQLAAQLRPLAEGLTAFVRGSGETWRDTIVVVLSEFGRTVRENGNGGTDHGHGNVIWVLGGGINGGRVYGDWPGLAPAQLYQKRDLAVTTDFRTVLAVILERHLRLGDRQLEAVLSDAPPASAELAQMIPG